MATALAGNVMTQSMNAAAEMTMADASTYLCRFMSADVRETPDDNDFVASASSTQVSCGEHSSCLRSASYSVRERTVLSFSLDSGSAVLLPPAVALLENLYFKDSSYKPPDLPDAPKLLASVLIKKE